MPTLSFAEGEAPLSAHTTAATRWNGSLDKLGMTRVRIRALRYLFRL